MATHLAPILPEPRPPSRFAAGSATATVAAVIADMTDRGTQQARTTHQRSTILEAFAEMREAYRLLFLLPESADEADEQLLFERHDRAREVLANTTATTPREHAAKLRAALQGIDHGGQNALLLHRLTELMDAPAKADCLQEADLFRGMVWSTICDLERSDQSTSV
jgi:hypothetical protein